MRLIDEMKDSCHMMDKTTVPDGLGGFTTAWTEGSAFMATIIKDSSTLARIAEKDGMKETYTIVVDKNVPLDFHDVFVREEDGQVFRVTSRTLDSTAPERSTVPIGKVSAERWELPSA